MDPLIHRVPYVLKQGSYARGGENAEDGRSITAGAAAVIRPLYLEGTSKNYPFAIWAHLLPQLFAAKIPQYTKYSGISATQFGTKSAAQIIKK